MEKRMTIRVKITIANILLLIIASFFLTLGSNKSAKILVNEVMPISNGEIENELNIISDQIPNISLKNDVISKFESEELIKLAAKNFNYSISSYMFLVILTGGLSTYLVMKRLLKPLESLAKKIEGINIDNLSDAIEIKNCDVEILMLTDKFNAMTAKLNKSFEVQKTFSQSAAHELRTPLTIIKTRLDVFKKKKDRAKDEYEALIDSIRENTERLSNVVENLLNITNFNEVDINEDINIDYIFNQIIGELNSYAEEKNMNIIYENRNLYIKGNETLLYRAFYNIIENAIRYGDVNGYVEIDVENNKSNTIFRIKDNGVGIPDDLKKDIFEAFFRGDKSRSRALGGVGLGLSIVKEIIKKHNGKIEVLNNLPKGTIFKIIL